MIRVTTLAVFFFTCASCGVFCAGAEEVTAEKLSKILASRVEKVVWPAHLDVLEGEAGRLAAEFGAPAIPALEAMCKGKAPSRDVARLAALMLAKMPDQPKAMEALERLVREADFRTPGQDAIDGIGYLPTPLARGLVERLARQATLSATRAECVDLMPAVGDENTLLILKALPKGGPKGRRYDSLEEAVNGSLPRLKKALSLDGAARRAWQGQALALWKANRSTTNTIIGPNYRETAKRLREIGVKFSADFLRDEIRLGSPMAVTFAGVQREAALIGDLKPLVSRPRDNGPFARTALQRIGTSAAVRALESALDSDDERVFQHTLLSLQQIGDRATLDLLRRSAADAKRNPKQRDAFRQAAERLEARIKARVEQPRQGR